MKRGWILLLVLSLGLNVGFLYNQLARDGNSKRGRHARDDRGARGDVSPEKYITDRLDRMTEKHQLDNAQREQMEEVLRRFVPAVMAQRRRLSEARERVLAELGAPAVNTEQVRARAAELNATQTELDSLVMESLLREVEVLTPEQRAGYVERFARGRGRPLGNKNR